MRKILMTAVVCLVFVAAAWPAAAAGTFYLHDHSDYWWYVLSDVPFSAVVPATAQTYIERNVFGMNILEILMDNGSVSIEIASLKNSTIESVRNSLEERFKPAVKDISVRSNRMITTSNNLQCHFYHYEATGNHGKKVMLRSVIFERNGNVVSLSLFLDADKYVGNVQQYWLRLVNDSEWN